MATSQVDPPGGSPIDLSWRQAYLKLAAAQKSSKGAPAYGRFVNRPLGRAFAATAYVFNRTPNQVTAISAAFTFSGIAVIGFLRPSIGWSLLSGVLLVIGYALDAADGQLARLQGSGSSAGEFLDHTVDALKSGVLHLAILASWFQFDDRVWLLLVPMAFQAVESVQFSSFLLTDSMRRAHRGGAPVAVASHRTSSIWYSLAKLPEDYGLLCVIIGLRFWTEGFTVVYTLLMITSAALLAIGLPRRYQEIRSYG